MNELQAEIDHILSLRDTEAVRRLCLDCWTLGLAQGEAAGLIHAANLRAGVLAYAAHERFLSGYGAARREVL